MKQSLFQRTNVKALLISQQNDIAVRCNDSPFEWLFWSLVEIFIDWFHSEEITEFDEINWVVKIVFLLKAVVVESEEIILAGHHVLFEGQSIKGQFSRRFRTFGCFWLNINDLVFNDGRSLEYNKSLF